MIWATCRSQHPSWRADEQAADRGAADDDELRRLVEHAQRAARHQVAADHAAEDDDEADDYEHDAPSP